MSQESRNESVMGITLDAALNFVNTYKKTCITDVKIVKGLLFFSTRRYGHFTDRDSKIW